MLTSPRVLIQSHALLAWTAAVTAPQMTSTSLTGAFAVVSVATRELIAARHLRVMQVWLAVVMAPRLIWTAPMAVTALAMMGLTGQTAQSSHLRWLAQVSNTTTT